jgi:hypothetical protein
LDVTVALLGKGRTSSTLAGRGLMLTTAAFAEKT